MKVLVVGSGGREHAMVCALAKSPKIDKLWCAPGNGGIAAQAECVNIKATTTEKLGFEGEGLGISSHAVACIEKA